jgi:hypothetical protein
MRIFVALWIVCALASSAEARSRRKCHGDCPPFGATIEVDMGTAQLSLADTWFSNTLPTAGGQHLFAVDGRNIGALHPNVFSIDLHETYMFVPHFALGIRIGALYGDLGKPVLADGELVDPRGAAGMTIGPEWQTVWMFGPLELRGILGFGYRTIGLTVPGILVPCKGGLCPATLDADSFYLEPRVSLAFDFGGFTVGGYAGGDVMPTGGWVAGGFIAARIGDWERLANFKTFSTRGLYH